MIWPSVPLYRDLYYNLPNKAYWDIHEQVSTEVFNLVAKKVSFNVHQDRIHNQIRKQVFDHIFGQ